MPNEWAVGGLGRLEEWFEQGVVSVDTAERRLIYASPYLARALGDPHLAGAPFTAALAQLFPSSVVALLDEPPVGDGSRQVDYPVTTSGVERWVRVAARSGGPHRVDLLISDITDTVRLQLAEARAGLLRTIAERLQDSTPLESVAATICAEVRHLLEAQGCLLTLFNATTGQVASVHLSLAEGVRFDSQPLGRAAASNLLQGNRVAQFADLRAVPQLSDQLVAMGVTNAAIAAIGPSALPMGLLKVLRVGPPKNYSDQDLALLASVAHALEAPLVHAALLDERARSAQKQQAAKEQLTAALDAADTGIWEFVPTTGEIHWDRRCYELWEIDPVHGADTSLTMSRVHPDDQPLLAAAYRSAMKPEGTGAFSIEYRYSGRAGMKCLAAKGRCLFDDQRVPRRFIGTLVDVTARRRAEEARRESERRYREIFENLSEGVGLLTPEGLIVFANTAYAHIFKFDDESEIIAHHIEELMFEEDRAKARDRWVKYLQSGNRGPLREVARFRTRDGQEVWLSLSSVPLFEEGIYTGILGVMTDVTESRRLEAKLMHSQKLESLGVLAGGIAHDFNNLLVGVLGNAGLARTALGPGSPILEAIDDIETAALRAADLTRQLLAYAGKARFVIGRIDLRTLVEEMAQLLSAAIGKGVVLRTEFDPGVPQVQGDATQLRQVVMNLITNASDAIGDKPGVITLSTRVLDVDRAMLEKLTEDLAPGRYVALQVVDTGSGMSPETQRRIFDPFFTTKFIGRGLGLAAVLGIMRAHHGTIQVASELGRGTTFTVWLPAVPEAVIAASAREQLAAQPAGKGVWVLVVDDEEPVRTVMKRALTQGGYQVLTAENGRQGVELFRGHQHDIRVVVLDVSMPQMGGEETFRRLREIDPTVRVLLSSGHSEQEATSQFGDHGLAGFLEKPFRPATLLEKVAAALTT